MFGNLNLFLIHFVRFFVAHFPSAEFMTEIGSVGLVFFSFRDIVENGSE